MADPVFCGICNTDVSDIPTLSEGSQYKCPNCGNLGRAFRPPTGALWIISSAAQIKVEEYPQILLRIAKRFIDENKSAMFGIAVAVMHMACEIAIERVTSPP
jgi:hypothetical protein